MTIPSGLLSWMPPTMAHYIYTVVLTPPPLRRAAQRVIKGLIPETIDFRGTRVVLNRDDPVLCGSLTLGCYETFITDLLESLLAPGMTFFDIGANIGIYTAMAARLVGSAGRVLAVEPSPVNVALIQKTVALNNFDNVHVAACAVADVDGQASLYLAADNPADNRLCDPTGQRVKVTVRTVTLDTLTFECGLPRADVVKIDTQGSEAAVISGMRDLLEKNPPPVMIMEFWPWGLRHSGNDPRALLDRLIDAGYTIYEINGNRRSIVRRPEVETLLRLHLERQYVELLLCRHPQTVEALRATLKCRVE
jgi:FkbM family methyltransferase